MATGLAAGLLWFLLFFIGHLLTLRLTPEITRAQLNNALFFVGLVGLSLTLCLATIMQLLALTLLALVAAIVCGTLLYCGLFALYMPFYYVVMTSLSVRTAIFLSRQTEGALTKQRLFNVFASSRLVDGRLRTMELNGFLRVTPKGYTLTVKGRLTAWFMEKFNRLWKLDTTG